MDEELHDLAEELAQQLLARDLKIATAESCTGGWVAKTATDIAGSSTWFDRGYVTYSNEAKQQMLGVSSRLLADEGAVSAAVVEAMVKGALTFSDADMAVAISGIAGPGGGSDEKPVGLVWFGWGFAGEEVISRMHCFEGDREAVRRQAVAMAFRGMIEQIDN